jgi:carbon monoxide dehydrogenase subunit G
MELRWPASVGRRARAVLIAMFFASPLVPGTLSAADGLRVEAARSGTGVAVSASASIHAPLDLIWNTLTDYEHLPEFIPGMQQSRIVSRRGPATIVEQRGGAGILFFTLPIRVTVESAEYPPHLITVRVLSGNLKQLDGRYQLERIGGGEDYILSWRGIIEPAVSLPAFISVPLMRTSVEDQFTGMVREIERRSRLRSQKAGNAKSG